MMKRFLQKLVYINDYETSQTSSPIHFWFRLPEILTCPTKVSSRFKHDFGPVASVVEEEIKVGLFGNKYEIFGQPKDDEIPYPANDHRKNSLFVGNPAAS